MFIKGRLLIKTGGGIENKEPGATIVKGSKERLSKTLKWELKLQRYLECKNGHVDLFYIRTQIRT